MKILVAILTAVSAIFAVPAQAQEAVPAQRNYIAQFDTNSDGVMTAVENNAGLSKRFMEMDTDGNGKISKDEFVKGHSKWLDKMDANQDGMVEIGEYLEFFCGQPVKAEDTGKDAKAKDQRVSCVAYRSRLFAVIDTNKDGKISPDEKKKFDEAAFDKMDKNADGVLEIDELYAFDIVAAPVKGDAKKAPKAGKAKMKHARKAKAAKAVTPAADTAATPAAK